MKKLTDLQLAQILWDYHAIDHHPTKADCILGLGNEDLRVAEYCAELYKKNFAPFIVFSGNAGNFTKNLFKAPEAHIFREVALNNGVPLVDILTEDTATNTGENIILTKKLLMGKNIHITNLIVVTKPNTKRRAYATVKKIWPEVNAIVLSPLLTFTEQPTALRSLADITNEMVGDQPSWRLFSRPFSSSLPCESPLNELLFRPLTLHNLSLLLFPPYGNNR